jgi:hypothetical protein
MNEIICIIGLLLIVIGIGIGILLIFIYALINKIERIQGVIYNDI